MKGKKEEVVIFDPPESLTNLISQIALLSALAVGGYFLFTTEGTVQAILLALVAGIGTFFGMVIIGAVLLVITSLFYRGWDKHFSSQAEYEAWKAQEEEAERQREEERERERREALARQEELKKAREQARADSITALKDFLSSLEEDPQAAKLLARLHAGPVDQGTINQALAHPDIVLAGIGSWLKRKGRYNNLPDVGLPKSLGKGEVERPLDDLFERLGAKERGAFLNILSQGAELAEEALAQGVSQREIIEMLLPLILS